MDFIRIVFVLSRNMSKRSKTRILVDNVPVVQIVLSNVTRVDELGGASTLWRTTALR